MRLSIVVCFLALAGVPLPAQYFPAGCFDKNPQNDESTANYYASFLRALHEPSLWELSRQKPEAEVYRFFWLRTFHHPIAVRLVVRKSGSGWMNAHVTSGHGGNQPGRIIRYSIFWLTKNQTQSFLTALDRVDFWRLPTEVQQEERIAQLDGARWIVEGVKNGQYHVIDRWSPDRSDPVRAIGLLALKLGRFRRLRSGEIY
jgi:hypothetical protein